MVFINIYRMAGKELLMLEKGQVKEGMRDNAGGLGSICQEQSKAGLLQPLPLVASRTWTASWHLYSWLLSMRGGGLKLCW